MSHLPRITRRPRPPRVIGLVLAASLVLGGVVSGGSAAAGKLPSTPTASAPHCLTRVTGQLPSGQYELSTPVCYATMADVVRNAGGTSSGARGGGVAAFGGTFILATHYDGGGFTGASISVQGTDCYGGYINLDMWWINRVSSTSNGCPIVTHFYWPNLGGTQESTYGGGGNLWSLDNLSESISYSGW